MGVTRLRGDAAPSDGTPRPFRVDYLRLLHPHAEDCTVLLNAVQHVSGEVCATGFVGEEDQIGDEIEPIPVADFLLDELYSIAGQLVE